MTDLATFLTILGILAAGLSASGVAVIRRMAERKRVLDIPNERSSHTRPTPRGGGLAMVLVVLGGMWMAAALGRVSSGVPLCLFTAGAILIAGISAWDDLRYLPVRVRFFAHALAAILAMLAFGYARVVHLPGAGNLPLSWVGIPLTFLWIMGLTNAYNFMDGIDGIAGGQAVVAGLGWCLLGWITGQPLVATLGLLVAAGNLGFLWHNWPPAKIFMGDVGSAFAGYTLAALTVMAAQSNPILLPAGVALVWPFIFDSGLTFIRRLFQGEPVWVAHRSHLYQRLVISGLSHGRVSLIYIGLALLGLTFAVTATLALPRLTLAGGGIILLAALALWAWTCRRNRSPA